MEGNYVPVIKEVVDRDKNKPLQGIVFIADYIIAGRKDSG
jgi:hypothetical protein